MRHRRTAGQGLVPPGHSCRRRSGGMDMRPRSRTITRRAMLTTVLVGATAALLTEATRPALAASTLGTATAPFEAPKQGSDYVVNFMTTQITPTDVKVYE